MTGRKDGQFRAGADGTMRVTLPEMIGLGSGTNFSGNYAPGYDLARVVKENFKDNWGSIAVGVVFIPMIAKSVTKLIRKPVILPANRMLKSAGLDVKV